MARSSETHAYWSTPQSEGLPPIGAVTLEGFDTVVMAVGAAPETGVVAELESIGVPVHVIGDAKQVRRLADAVEEGARVALAL